MLARFSGSVTVRAGRTPALQPGRQIVLMSELAVTAGSSAPGVQRGSGSTYRPEPRAWQLAPRGHVRVVLDLMVKRGRCVPCGLLIAPRSPIAASAVPARTAA
jgi:hypothetical protein